MSHARKTIRSAIATILAAATPTNWSQVVESRIQSSLQIWPYLMVFADSEVSEPVVINPTSVYERRVNIVVVGLIRLPGSGDTYTVEDKMDALAEEVETKLTGATLRAAVPRAQSIALVATEMNVVIEAEGIDHGEVNMSFVVQYATLEGVPAALI